MTEIHEEVGFAEAITSLGRKSAQGVVISSLAVGVGSWVMSQSPYIGLTAFGMTFGFLGGIGYAAWHMVTAAMMINKNADHATE